MTIAIVLSAAALSATSAMACSVNRAATQASPRSGRQQTAAASQADQATVVARSATETTATATE